MALNSLMTEIRQHAARQEFLHTLRGSGGHPVHVYRASARVLGNDMLFIGREMIGKYLYVVREGSTNGCLSGFEGEEIHGVLPNESLKVYRCPMNHENAVRLREIVPFTKPCLLGLADSFGFGDRLGIANPAHIRSLSHSHMRPVLAQQSIRELDRTQRTAGDVLDAASWAVFQEGFTDGFGADADHLKTEADIDRYAQAGFTMYTFDPSAHVRNEAATLPFEDVRLRAKEIKLSEIDLAGVLERYAGRTFHLDDGSTLQPGEEEITRAYVKYGSVCVAAAGLYRYLRQKYSSMPTEVELSVDETDIPTTPIEHLFIAGDLKRMNVEWVSLAPRFIGDFEKGVDYRGDLQAFKREYLQHLAIAKMFGPYKISIHSGSDKFSIYRVIGSIRKGAVHVKTAGTSYLEALRTVASADPVLLRSILDFARGQYEDSRKSYHVTGRLDRVPESRNCTDAGLTALFDQHDARQVFHVTFGKVLTERKPDGTLMFKDRFMTCLDTNEQLHYETIIRHFRKHLDPFEK